MKSIFEGGDRYLGPVSLAVGTFAVVGLSSYYLTRTVAVIRAHWNSWLPEGTESRIVNYSFLTGGIAGSLIGLAYAARSQEMCEAAGEIANRTLQETMESIRKFTGRFSFSFPFFRS